MPLIRSSSVCFSVALFLLGPSNSQFSKPNSVTKTGISSHILPNVMITYIDIDKNIVFPSYSMTE